MLYILLYIKVILLWLGGLKMSKLIVHRVFFDTNMFLLSSISKGIIYSDKLQKMLLVDKPFLRDTSLFLQKIKNGEKIKYANNNALICTLLDKGIIFKKKTDFLTRCDDVKTQMLDKSNMNNYTTVYLHLTQRCNLNCSYCYNKENLNAKKELSKEQWFEIALMLHKINVKKIILTGGEVFLRTDIEDIVNYFYKQEYNIEILTNGTLLDKHYDILQYVNKIIISLDGISDNDNKLRINSDKYNILKNLEMIPTAYKEKVFIRSVLTTNNENSINNTKKYIEEQLGLKFIINDLVPCSKKDFLLLSNKYLDFQSKSINKIEFSFCSACSNTLAIDSNGDLYPCQSLVKKDLLITNVFNENWIEKLTKSKICKKFLSVRTHYPRQCRKCCFKFICGGGCRAIAKNLYGKIKACNADMCDRYKHIISSNLLKLVEKYEQ